MRRFWLYRTDDESGVSGVGIVAEGTLYSTGKVTLCWVSALKSVAVYDSIDDLITIHSHGGKTEIRWIDKEPNDK